MKHWLSSGAVWLTLWTVLFFGIGWLPGFAGLSYPMSIVLGVILGPAGALIAARSVFAARSADETRSANETARGEYSAELSPSDVLFLRALGNALLLFGLATATALVHGLRVGFCEFGSDLLRWLLGPGAGALAAGAWGAVIGSWPLRFGGWRWLFALALPLFSYGVSFVRFYTSPMVFAFDHFVGFFAGTLYDTELGSLERLWTYRLGTAGFVGCAYVWVVVTRAWARRRFEMLRFEMPRFEMLRFGKRRPAKLGSSAAWLWSRIFGGACSVVLVVVVYALGPRLGHYQTDATILDVLKHRAATERCVVHFGAGVSPENAQLLARECTAHVAELERFFDVAAPSKTRVLLFSNADQKAWFMGARHVYIAKPWRREIYIQASGFPHPVLRHELAHVVAGGLGQGPFAIAGSAGGLIPDPGRIEGFAVAAAPPEDEPLSLLQWASAMKQLGLLPRLTDLFQFGFFATNSSTSYTVAGAFVTWLRAGFGAETLARWYGGETLQSVTGLELGELEARFRARLDEEQLTENELAAARARFDRPGVLARKCPYQVDAALGEGLGLVAALECADARERLEKVLEMDPTALRAELGLAQCAFAEGSANEARAKYRGIATNHRAHQLFQAVAWERLGDVEWQNGNTDAARAHYERAQALLIEEERLRQLDVKLAGVTAADELERQGIASVFFGNQRKGPVAVQTGLSLGRWAESTNHPLALYLIGKQFWAVGDWATAQGYLERALTAGRLPSRVQREAVRGALLTACATGDGSGVAKNLEVLERSGLFSATATQAWQNFARRCRGSLQDAH